MSEEVPHLATRAGSACAADDGLIGVLDEIPLADCLALLASHEVGRIAVVVDGQPHIFPVNYVLDGEVIVFRSGPGLKLSGAAYGAVAFEIDEIDPGILGGWSVAVAGFGREFTGALDRSSARQQGMPLVPWAGGAKDHWVQITDSVITGRRLRRREPGGR